MEKALEKDKKFGAKCDRTKLKNDENLEEKCTEMRPLAEYAASRIMVHL